MTTPTDTRARVFAVRMWTSLLATQELLSTYLGVRLGLYDDLAAKGPGTVEEIAQRTGVDPRYAREWLEQQAVAGILTVDDAARSAETRVFALPAAHAEVLTVSDSPVSMAALAVLPLGGVAAALPALLEAYRSGDGVSDAVYGVDWREGHAGANRSMFTHQLAGWLRRHAPDVHARLSGAPARVADVACGAGWAGIGLARAFPGIAVDGYDIDADVIDDARGHAADAGLTDRVSFFARDAADPELAGGYDLVCLFDALHEISRPVEVLRACRRLCADGGSVLVLDARVAERFTAPADEIERFQYATSVLHCLPACLSQQPSAGTGTVLRPQTVRELAVEAGFAAVTQLPIDDRFHRLYRLIG
ncbi:Methyltransferase domain-containing protein [Micromonospora phaseoli]|uniref:Methyltransferase domain-containing protein n=1 Tax=Micromonospora phaseoli TaxID=1144548 RepID=A0A1H6YC44_9ACTN|nr:methyltransferase domain-containing protein [Micromonospora phaseoli]PZW00126.1 methyltransferase family protein [Micromonospora phaseoli]GIJ78832.1 SAM-dependent methyltransferase [Micromonospora phaseoli]SEJ38819.1 Methyltransferase domain-containing protein [Micromonospora phaseoli]